MKKKKTKERKGRKIKGERRKVQEGVGGKEDKREREKGER